MTTYKNLDVWKKSMDLVRDVYILVRLYPKDELYGLGSQTRRAAVSIPVNIAEGVGRNYKRDSIQFLHISRGSLYELETLLNIAEMIALIEENKFQSFTIKIDECIRLLNGLISYFEKANLK